MLRIILLSVLFNEVNFSTTNSTRNSMGSNRNLRDNRLVTNNVNHAKDCFMSLV
jgi:hypothetical protein